MIREVQDGEDYVLQAVDRSNAASRTDALRLDGSTGKATLDSLALTGTYFQQSWNKDAADGAAATATAEHAFYRASDAVIVKGVRYVPDATLTADNANYATITVQKRKADGSGNVTVASVTTQITGSGNWTAFAAVALALTNANVSLAAGEILTVEITKTGTGVVVPAGQLVVDTALA